MYTSLVCFTIFVIAILVTGAITAPGWVNGTDNKKCLVTLSLFASALLVSVTFVETTTAVLSKTNDVKQSKQPWHVIYKNNINANVKIEASSGWGTPITPKDTVSKKDFNRFMPGPTFFNDEPSNEADVDITATNDVDSTTKSVTLTKDNIIETWPKGTKPNKSKGHITKIEYRSTPVTLKWFTIPVGKTDYKEIRITIEYDGTNDTSTKQLFGDE